jgi:outer membrane protein assembly factor BamA
MICRIYFILILLIFNIPLFPQENTTFFKDEKKNEKYDAGAPVFSPLILPAYTPEMGFYFIGGTLISFKTKRNNDYLSHSVLPITTGINMDKDFYISGNLYSYWLDDRLLLFIDGYYQNRKDNYWGIGMSDGKTINKSDSTTQYKNESFRVCPALSVKLIPHVYLGIKADFNKTMATHLSDLMLEDPNLLKNGTVIKNTGLGFIVSYDSRDVPTDPHKGFYIHMEELFYSKTLSGDCNYEVLGLDYRHFLPLARNGSLLALQLKSNIGFGNVPWTDMQMLGTPNDLRGYYWGQYRDMSSLIFQMEYRHTFSFDNSENLSRHGFVFWMGGGTVFPDFGEINDLLFSTGIGYRFEIQPRKKMKIDIGFGTENVGIYIGYNESF